MQPVVAYVPTGQGCFRVACAGLRRRELHTWRLLVKFAHDKGDMLHYLFNGIPNFAAMYMYHPHLPGYAAQQCLQ